MKTTLTDGSPVTPDQMPKPRTRGQRSLAEAKTTIWSQFPRASITFGWRQHEAISALAVQRGTTFAETVRFLVDQALTAREHDHAEK